MYTPLLGICILYLICISVVLNVAAASSAFAIVEVPAAEGNGGKLLFVGAEPGSAAGVRTLPTPGATHVVDDGVHVDVHLRQKEVISVG